MATVRYPQRRTGTKNAMTFSEVVCNGDPPTDSVPARLTIGIISAGRVGTALGVALERADHVGRRVQRDFARVAAARRTPAARHRHTAGQTRSRAAPNCCCWLSPTLSSRGLVSGLAATLGGAARHDRRPHVGRQRHRGAGPADRAGLHPAGHPSRDDVHRLGRGHRATARHLLRRHRRRRGQATRSRSRWCSRSAASRSGSARMPGTLYHAALAHASNHVVTVVLDAVRGAAVRRCGARSCWGRNWSATRRAASPSG